MTSQSFLDEFGAGKKKQLTQAKPNMVFKRPVYGKLFVNKDKSKYWSGIRKMMHMMKLSRPDIYNSTQDFTRHIMLAGRTH